MEATGLGTFLLDDSSGKTITVGRGVTRSATPGPAGEFAVRDVAHGAVVAFILRSTADHRRLVASHGRLRLTTRNPRSDQFQLLAHKRCRRFPEAGVNAAVHGPGRRGTGTPRSGSAPTPTASARCPVLPGRRDRPLRYPFKSHGGAVTFSREKTGTRVFDLNKDGVACYGVIPDLLADMQRTAQGRRAMALLFGSAQACLDTWRRAFARR